MEAMVQGIKDKNIQLVAFDFDLTISTKHTGGNIMFGRSNLKNELKGNLT